jgi:hypothetical protein
MSAFGDATDAARNGHEVRRMTDYRSGSPGRIGVSKNRLTNSDPNKKAKPSTMSNIPTRAAINPQSSRLATEGASGVGGGIEEAGVSWSSVDAAKSVSTSTEGRVARSGVT